MQGPCLYTLLYKKKENPWPELDNTKSRLPAKLVIGVCLSYVISLTFLSLYILFIFVYVVSFTRPKIVSSVGQLSTMM